MPFDNAKNSSQSRHMLIMVQVSLFKSLQNLEGLQKDACPPPPPPPPPASHKSGEAMVLQFWKPLPPSVVCGLAKGIGQVRCMLPLVCLWHGRTAVMLMLDEA